MAAAYFIRARLGLASGAASVLLAGCATPMHTTHLAGGPDPVVIEAASPRLRAHQPVRVVVRSPGADSLALESANGLDRYWTRGPVLGLVLTSDFGDTATVARYAERYDGHLLDLLRKPARVVACREGRCRSFDHELAVELPERNQRTMVVTAGWNSVFARRSIRGANRTVLFEEVLNSSVWSLEGAWAGSGWNGRLQGFLGQDERGGSLDLSHVIKRTEGLSYGLALHAGATRSGWLSERPGSRPAAATAYRVSLGPSLMHRGITASSQLGIYTDGIETLQISSTRVSVDGRLTSVRHPVTLTAEKTFAFGGGAIVSRRRDALERLTAGIRLYENFAVNVGVSSHRMAWPNADPADDVRAAETVMTLGGQYSLTW